MSVSPNDTMMGKAVTSLEGKLVTAHEINNIILLTSSYACIAILPY